jgi:hypothetical protein
MTDVLRVKHARHNAQPTARQQQHLSEGPAGAEAAGIRGLNLAAGANSQYLLLSDMLCAQQSCTLQLHGPCSEAAGTN